MFVPDSMYRIKNVHRLEDKISLRVHLTENTSNTTRNIYKLETFYRMPAFHAL